MILLANDYVGLKITEYLCETKENIEVLVYTEKGNPSYNEDIIGMIVKSNPQAEVYRYDQFVEKLSEIKALSVQYGVLAWWPHILTKEMIEVVQRGFINTHPAYLPYNRGKHPYFWCMYDGTPFGVSLHFIDEQIDAGSIIARKAIPYTWEDTGETLYLRAREEMIDLFVSTYGKIKDNITQVIDVDWSQGTFHYGKDLEKVCKIELDKSYTARELLNITRGRMFRGLGEAFFEDNGKKYGVSISIREILE